MPSDFSEETLYAPSHWFVHELLTLTPARVLGRTDTTRLGDLAAAQILRHGHVAHVPAAVMIQITATLANLHTVYALGHRVSQGWVGYGTHVKSARFPSFGEIGPALDVELVVKRLRRLHGKIFAEYQFTYTQGERVVYQSEQSAIWFDSSAPLTPPSDPAP